ncbi:MAG: MBOAT family O-acyltransferase [Phycisphaerales bacterium]
MRFVSAALCLMIVGKLYDLHHGETRCEPVQLTSFALFMVNPFTLVQRRMKDEPTPPARTNLIRLGRGAVIFALGEGVGALAFGARWETHSFALEHIAKILCSMIAIYGGAELAIAAWRLIGLRGRAPMHNFFTARTPAEFWRRYNRMVSQFFFENVFRRSGLRRSPFLATMVVFLLFGAMHEYLFVISIGRIEGFALAFFVIQGLAVAVTLHRDPQGTRALGWVSATIGFNLVTSILYFAALDRLGPYYSDALPFWLSPR